MSSPEATFLCLGTEMCLRHSRRAAGRNMKVYRDHVPMRTARTPKKKPKEQRKIRDASSGPCLSYHIHRWLCYRGLDRSRSQQLRFHLLENELLNHDY